MKRSAWMCSFWDVVAQLRTLRRRIDDLGDDAVTIVGDDQPDMVACFASNSLEGTQALLRDLERLVMAKKKAPAKKKGGAK